MQLLIILSIAIGLSLDIFCAVVCRGAMFAKIQKSKLAILCSIFCLAQLALFLLGYGFSEQVLQWNVEVSDDLLPKVFSCFIFTCIGVRMIRDSIRNNPITEHRVDQIDLGYEFKLSIKHDIYALFAGIACGFSQLDFLQMLISIPVCTLLFVISGYYSGYHYGYTPKTKAYVIGGVLLFLASVGILLS